MELVPASDSRKLKPGVLPPTSSRYRDTCSLPGVHFSTTPSLSTRVTVAHAPEIRATSLSYTGSAA